MAQKRKPKTLLRRSLIREIGWSAISGLVAQLDRHVAMGMGYQHMRRRMGEEIIASNRTATSIT